MTRTGITESSQDLFWVFFFVSSINRAPISVVVGLFESKSRLFI